MRSLKKTVFAAAAVAAIALMPVTPAAAAGLAPWVLGRHVVGAVVGLATLPFAVLSAALSADEWAAPYPPTPDYGGPSPGYYARPKYYTHPRAYYAPPPAYDGGIQSYYRPAISYARPMPRFYAAPRGYYAPRAHYTGSYRAHGPYRSGNFANRRR